MTLLDYDKEFFGQFGVDGSPVVTKAPVKIVRVPVSCPKCGSSNVCDIDDPPHWYDNAKSGIVVLMWCKSCQQYFDFVVLMEGDSGSVNS